MDCVPIFPPREKSKRSAAAAILSRDWPVTFRACTSTYFSYAEFGTISAAGVSPAGYILKALLSAEDWYLATHGARPVQRTVLDQAFSSEVWYHFRRSTTFRRPQAVLWVAWHNMITERPEKIWQHCAKTNLSGAAFLCQGR